MSLNSRQRFEEQIRARQRNTVWPEPLQNSSSVDKLLWRGAADVTLVQRIGIGIFGCAFLVGAIAFAMLAYRQQSAFLYIFALCWALLGVRVFVNAFRRR